MKILLIGDTHFRFQLPYATAVADARRGEWESVKNKIIEVSKTCEVAVFLGDVFNSKHNHSSVNTELVSFLNKFPETMPIHLIAGNHERFGHDTALDFITEFNHPNWTVYKDPTGPVNLGSGKTAMFLPYMTPGTVNAANNEEARDNVMAMLKPADYLFHHHIVESTKWEGGDSSVVNELVLPATVADNYSMVFGGHIHQPSKVNDKVWVVGNIFTNEVGEHEKFIFILDTDTNTVEKIKLPLRGIYKVEITAGQNIPTDIPDQSIVKVTVYDRTLQGAGVEALRSQCARFDSYVLIEQYSKQRKKVNLNESGALDLSIDNLLKVYAEQRKVNYPDLVTAFNLIE
jgi:DNA repair exonuclease SbcCD nuclease subunit